MFVLVAICLSKNLSLIKWLAGRTPVLKLVLRASYVGLWEAAAILALIIGKDRLHGVPDIAALA